MTGGGTLNTSGNIQAFTVSEGVPSLILGSPFSTGTSPYGLAIASGGGFLYTANNTDSSISEFTINGDGSLTQLASSPVGTQFIGPVALQIDKSGKFMYVANEASTNLSGYSIGTDGSLAVLSTSPLPRPRIPARSRSTLVGSICLSATRRVQ